MPEAAEFEEKEYECFFNGELAAINRQIWSPGQVLEGKIGFDGAAMIDPEILFLRRHYDPRAIQHLSKGVRLDSDWIREVFKTHDRYFPNYNFNFFVQYKRPDFVYGNNSGQRSYWSSPYYRYTINKKQNRLLEKLQSVCGRSAIITYACPSFHTKESLWNAHQNLKIVGKSNFANPTKLATHDHYTFTKPGNRGYAHSEPEEIISPNIYEQVTSILSNTKPEPLSKLIKEAGKSIEACFEELNGHAALGKKIARDIVEMADDDGPLITALAHIYAAKFVFGTTLLVMGQNASESFADHSRKQPPKATPSA
mgnify:CR=1 FL=1